MHIYHLNDKPKHPSKYFFFNLTDSETNVKSTPTIGNILHLNKLLSTPGQLTAVKTLCIRIPDIEMVPCGTLHFFGLAKQSKQFN